MKRPLLAASCIAGALIIGGVAQTGPVFAQGAAAPKSYFCSKHPNNPNCKAVPPTTGAVTGGGGTYTGTFGVAGTVPVVSTIAGSPHLSSVAQLPASGGGVPVRVPDRTPVYLLLGLFMCIAGASARVAARKRLPARLSL